MVRARASRARESILTDSRYLEALRAFNNILSRRVDALQAEERVYRQWLTTDWEEITKPPPNR
jgi:hypothetical protein